MRHIDFLELLQSDIAIYILMCLDDPADLIRASSVSRLWRDLVITNGLPRQLCLRRFPLISVVSRTMQIGVGSAEWLTPASETSIYASLLHALTKPIDFPLDCIKGAFSASSTDNYPHESIINTLVSRELYTRSTRYWSSKGHSNPDVPEALIYKLAADLCLISELKIRPFEVFWEPGKPVYSAKSVRFQMGYPKSPSQIKEDLKNVPLQEPADDKFVWTYTSPEFPMAQENVLQCFKLPEPVLCIGGFLKVELLGIAQREEIDGLFYICVANVQAMGRRLSPAFQIEHLHTTGKFLLKYYGGMALRQMLEFLPPRPLCHLAASRTLRV